MVTTETLIITATLIVVVSGGLAVFFWWRMQYGVWSRPWGLDGRPNSGGGTVISKDFDTRQQRGTLPDGNEGVPTGGTSTEAERLRLMQLGAVVGLVAGGVGLPREPGRDGADILLNGATVPPRALGTGDLYDSGASDFGSSDFGSSDSGSSDSGSASSSGASSGGNS